MLIVPCLYACLMSQLSTYMRVADCGIIQILSPLRFTFHQTVSAYEATLREWLEFQHTSLSSHELSVGRHMVAYRSYMEEQRFLTAKSLDVKILSRALSRFTSLEELNIDFWDKHIGARELIEAFGPFRCQGLLTQDCEYTLPVIFRALSRSTAEVKTLGLGYGAGIAHDIDGNPNLGDAAFAGYDRFSLRHSGPRRPEESITGSICRPGIAGITPHAMGKIFTWRDDYGCKYALKRIRKLQIGNAEVLSDDRGSPLEMSMAIGALIGFAPLLETITLKGMDGRCPKFPSFTYIFGTHHLKGLRNLDLLGYEATERFLIDFFTRHSATIVNVCLRSMKIIDSDWCSVLALLRDVNFPVLETFELDYWYEDAGSLWAQDYILHRTDKDPIVEEEERQERSLSYDSDEGQSSQGAG